MPTTLNSNEDNSLLLAVFSQHAHSMGFFHCIRSHSTVPINKRLLQMIQQCRTSIGNRVKMLADI